MRLNRYLAQCTELSRRKADALIQEGEVRINGEICDNPATQVGEGDEVRWKRRLLKSKALFLIAYNKPPGLVTTKKDEFNRPTIYSDLPMKFLGLNHVGRLDKDSEGLLLLTNDGALAQKLTHPSESIEKEYHVTLSSSYPITLLEQLKKGVNIPDVGRVKAKDSWRLSSRRSAIVIDTGIKRQVRLMFSTLGFRVQKLVRVRIGSLTMGELPLGKCEELDEDSIKALTQNPKPHKPKQH